MSPGWPWGAGPDDGARAVRRCFRIARRALDAALAARDPERAGDEAAIALILAVAGAEAFLTAQVIEALEDRPAARPRILRDLKDRRALDHKLAVWPSLALGGPFDLDRGWGADLLAAKGRRNALLHGAGDIGLAEAEPDFIALGDAPGVHDIDADEAGRALAAALGLVDAVLRRRGFANAQIIHLRRAWIGPGDGR